MPHPQPGEFHHSDQGSADVNAGMRKISMQAWCSIGAPRDGMRGADFRHQRGVHHGTLISEAGCFAHA
jgi:hypothetical protein